MTQEFLLDKGVAVEPLGEGRYAAYAGAEWDVFLGPNGGYLTALILNAQIHELSAPERRPRSLAVHFISRINEGPVTAEVATERVGRSFSSTTAKVFQEGRLCATSHCAFAVERGGDSYAEITMPAIAAPEDLPVAPVPPDTLPRFSQNFEYRFALGGLPFSGADEALLGGWIRTNDQRPLDAIAIACLSDAFPPAVFARTTAPVAAPTIDLTVHFLGVPEPDDEWALCRFEAPIAQDGIMIEDGFIWNRGGKILARTRQLALYR